MERSLTHLDDYVVSRKLSFTKNKTIFNNSSYINSNNLLSDNASSKCFLHKKHVTKNLPTETLKFKSVKRNF